MKLIKVVLVLLTVVAFISCDSDEADPVISCFEDSYNGNYQVTGSVNDENYNGSVVFEKLSCTTAKFVALDYTENITALEVSGSSGYIGKESDGSSISIAISGNTITIVSDNHNFTGDK